LSVVVREITTAAEVEAAVRLCRQANAGDPAWIAPDLATMRRLLTRRSAFCHHGRLWPLLAMQDGRPVATLTAFEDPRYEAEYGECIGTVGLFEALPGFDAAVGALFEEALARVRAFGAVAVWGPQNGHQNYGFGLLAEGHGVRPLVGMAYQPPYYDAYLRAAGFRIAHRYNNFTIPLTAAAVETRIRAARSRLDPAVRLVPVTYWGFRAATAHFADLHTRAFHGIWGDSSVAADEAWEIIGPARLAVPRHFFQLAELDGRAVGFVFCMPDFNQVFDPGMDEPSGPRAAFALLTRRSRIRRAALFAIGVLAEARRRGIAAALAAEAFDAMRRRGYAEAVYAGVLDDNAPSRALAASFGGTVSGTWAVYERRPA
jgi:ribosomal protein S18 acetylase RimI-like enzyme